MKLAILSASRIVKEFLEHIGEMPGITPAALCCRPESRAKAEQWAAQYGIPAVYTDEAALYAEHFYDAVYIGTANHLHYSAAKRALLAGHSVILEKPFTATAAEAAELYRLADEKGVFLLEAITTPYLPHYRFLLQQLPKIGPVRHAAANFSARSARYDDYLAGIWNTTFDPACNGGALNDMNIYNLHYFWGMFGTPYSAEYRPSLGTNGIDTAGLAVLQYDGFSATAFSAKDSASENGCLIQGTGGALVLHGGTNAMETVYATVDGQRVEGPAQPLHRMAYEFLEFARILAEKDRAAEAAARERTLAVMELLETVHENTL